MAAETITAGEASNAIAPANVIVGTVAAAVAVDAASVAAASFFCAAIRLMTGPAMLAAEPITDTDMLRQLWSCT